MSKLNNKNTTFSSPLNNQQNSILQELNTLIGKKSLPFEEVRELFDSLSYEPLSQMLGGLLYGVKPETATGELLKALLKDVLNWNAFPEVSQKYGFADFAVQEDTVNPVLIELKPLFNVKKESKKLTRDQLAYQQHSRQIRKYLADNEYIILTNLDDVYIFNRNALIDFKPFHEDKFPNLLRTLKGAESLWDKLHRLEDDTEKGDLEKEFFRDLKKWYHELQEVSITPNNGMSKEELSVLFLNKMIFIKTLEDYGLIPFKFLDDLYWNKREKWKAKGDEMVFDHFFHELENWFWEFYNTELFKTSFWVHVDRNKENLQIFHKKFRVVTGLDTDRKGFGKGLIHFNYRMINEDVFGKAYETFIAESRREEGIYYTPRYITEYMAHQLVDKLFGPKTEAVMDHLDRGEIVEAQKIYHELAGIKIADIASGSGSFLIKALRRIYEYYRKMATKTEWVNQVNRVNVPQHVEDTRTFRDEALLDKPYKLIATVILRHIHAVDKDERALDTAKTNLWKEAVKLEPNLFHYNKLGSYNHILPSLEMNFIHGDSLIDLSLNYQIDLINRHHKAEIQELHKLRTEYLRNPFNPSVLNSIETYKENIYKTLSNHIPIEGFKVFFPLEFFYAFFDEKGNSLPEEERGFGGIIGNPPYKRVQEIDKVQVDFLKENYSTAQKRNFDLYIPFLERGVSLLSRNGMLNYIVPHKFLVADYGESLRELLRKETLVEEILHFGHEMVFDDASTYTCILTLNKKEKSSFNFTKTKPRQISQNLVFDKIEYSSLPAQDKWQLTDKKGQEVFKRLNEQPYTFNDALSEVFTGIQTSADRIFILKGKVKEGFIIGKNKASENSVKIERGLLKPLIKGEDIKRYAPIDSNSFLIFPYHLKDGKTTPMKETFIKEHFPEGYRFLKTYENELRNRESGKMDINGKWFLYGRNQNIFESTSKKFVSPDLTYGMNVAIEPGKYCLKNGAYGILIKEEYQEYAYLILALLNSQLLWFYLQITGSVQRGGYFRFNTQYIMPFPIPDIKMHNTEPITQRVEQVIESRKNDPAADTSSLESEIDDLIMALYGLNEKEKEFVKDKNK